MSFLDKVTKAVSETMDRGKKEVDQFRRTQKIKGEISEIETLIENATERVRQVKLQVAERALELLRAGTLTTPELQAFVGQLASVEQEIAAHRVVIGEKRAEIERIKAEDEAVTAEATPPVTTAPAPLPPPLPPAIPPATPPVVPAAAMRAAGDVAPGSGTPAARFCPNCDEPVAENAAFCRECGTKLG